MISSFLKFIYSDNQKKLNRKTKLYEYFSVFDVVTKQILTSNLLNFYFSEMGLFPPHNWRVSFLLDFLKL